MRRVLALARELGDKRGIAEVLNSLGQIDLDQNVYDRAYRYFEESLALRRILGDRGGVALALGNMGATAVAQEKYALARTLLEESLAIRRQIEDTSGIAFALANLGDLACSEKNFSAAFPRYQESLELFRSIGMKWAVAYLLANTGSVLLALQDLATAQTYLTDAIRLSQEISNSPIANRALANLARLARMQGEPERAACLMSASENIRQSLGYALFPIEVQELHWEQAELQKLLSEAALESASQRGRMMTLEEAVTYALDTGHLQ